MECDEMKTRDAHYSSCCGILQLKPFCHQVAGHSSMLQLDDKTLCKPMNSREKRFYESIPTDLKKFTPQYRGVIYVTVEEDQDGYVNLLAESPCPSLSPSSSTSSTGSSTSSASFVAHSCCNSLTIDSFDSPGKAASLPVSSTPGEPCSAADQAGPCCSFHRSRSASEDIPTIQPGHTCVAATTSCPFRRSKSCRTKMLSSDSSERGVKLKGSGGSGSTSSLRQTEDGRYESYGTGSTQRLIFEDDKLYLGKDCRKGSKGKGVGHNPWSLRMHHEQLKRMRRDTKSHRFILLENVVSQLQYPCILDLKMGTRLHGDDAPKDKRERQIAKCNSSTSSKLGVRISGMQVHQVTSGKYLCRNKYYCRQFSVDDFMSCIRLFLHNDFALRRDIIRRIIALLNELLRRLEAHHTFRFYSSSLLIMYDGRSEVAAAAAECGECCGNNSTGEDDDIDCPGRCSSCSKGASEARKASQGVEPKVNVKMIDFAHVTYEGFHDDAEVHSGPDSGYLFGLKNLIRIFTEIFNEDEGDRRVRLWDL